MKYIYLLATVLYATASVFQAQALPAQPENKNVSMYTVVETQQDVGGHYVTDPSANSAIFVKNGDMTFIVVPEKNGTSHEDSKKQKRNAIRDTRFRWPNGVIPYEISSVYSADERATILQGMNHWEVNTCIRFREKNSNDAYYISIIPGRGCASFIGRQHRRYQPQGVSLSQFGCIFVGTVAHELGHVVGFYHEHTRPDRDEHVEVIFENIQHPDLYHNFRKVDPSQTNLLGLGYDYASIMHYRSTAFSSGGETIRVRDPSIPIGRAEELSPLDIRKANLLYNCGPKSSHPPISTTLPAEPTLSLPTGYSCGDVITASSGTFQSPGYPSHRPNQDCAWVIKVPEGYNVRVRFHDFGIEESTACSKDYVQLFYGASASSDNAASRGRICERRYSIYSLPTNVITLVYHTDGSNTQNDVGGLRVSFEARDVDECRQRNRCHSCRNLPGSFQCTCRDGFYLSTEARTCYDVNECAVGNGGCEHRCINSGGSYRCECNTGFFLQADGLSCGRTRPGVTPPPPTPPTQPTRPPTTQPPTTVTPGPHVQCGGNLTASSGSLQTPNWPQTYPVNIDCEWFITLPDASKAVEISFNSRPFGIAGNLPECEKDYLKVYDGHSNQDTSIGPFCYFTVPDAIKTSTNLAKIVFHAGPAHSSSRRGFKAVYRSVERPTTPPLPTTRPTTQPPPPTTQPTTQPPTTQLPPTTQPTTQPPTTSQCGGHLTASSGSLQTPNWPETYPVNIDCEWFITLPDASKAIEISFNSQPFGIAGNLPECEKDYLKVYDGHSNQDTSFGPFCYFTVPDAIKTSTNLAKIVFHAGPAHSSSRRGFKANYRSVERPTTPPPPTTRPPPPTTQPTTQPPPTTQLPPTTQPTTQPPTTSQCGGHLTASSGSFQTPNWPETYPVNIDCEWSITLPDASKVAELTFQKPFGIAGRLPGCEKDYLKVYDGDGQSVHSTYYGPFCHFRLPGPITTRTNQIRIVFHAGPAHFSSRKGFKASYISVDRPGSTLPPPVTTASQTTQLLTTQPTTQPPSTRPPSPPTTQPTTQPPTTSQCGGHLTASSGLLQTPNWPETYPVNIDCEWFITLPDASKVALISFNRQTFGIAGFLPECEKDYLKVYDGHSNQDTSFGPFCYYTVPDHIKTSTNLVKIVFHAGPAHSSSRKGFKASYISVDA